MTSTIFDSITGQSEVGAAPSSWDLSASFSTGAGSVVLTDVKLGLYADSPLDGGSLTVVLESDSSTNPNTVIATLGTIEDSSLSGNVNTFSTIDLAIENGPTLAAGTRYWIALVPTNSSDAWVGAGSASGTGVSTEYVHNTQPGFGPPPFDTPTTGSYANSSTGTPYMMEIQDVPACFCAGTAIATPGGEVAVQDLRAGDLVCLPDGGRAAVRWLGRSTVSRRFADPLHALPVRIRAGALGEAQPRRDLLVSPAHAMRIDGLLVQAGALVNGTSVVREVQAPEVITYFHLELDSHALLLAEGAATESFCETAEPRHFDNADERTPAAVMVEMDLPRVKAARQIPPATRARLAQRAAAVMSLVTAA